MTSPVDKVHFPDGAYPDGHLRWMKPQRSERLRSVPLWELGSELLLRVQGGEGFQADDSSAWLGSKLLHALQDNLDIHNNRYSRQRYRDLFSIFHTHVEPRPAIEGSTYVDLGCGSMNPYGMLFLFLMLGAKKGIAVDLDEVQDESLAVKACGALAGMLLLDPQSIVEPLPIAREQILRNLAGFDLGKLRTGDVSGMDRSRIEFRNESVFSMSLRDGEADFVFSNAFLEHIPQLERGVRELARIARPGGVQCHNIDVSDHRRYGGSHGPLDFLTEDSREEIVHQSNRLRMHEIAAIFARNGFEVLATQVYNTVQVTDAMRARFAAPFRSMTNSQLEPLGARMIVRRR